MRDSDKKAISSANENRVRDWFELSGFSSTRLDRPDGKTGTSADWRLSKQQTTIICEVKTIFSGGQAGETKYQYERRIQEAKRKLDFGVTNLPKGEQFIAPKDYLDFAQDKIPYQAHTLRKEEAFHQFLDEIRSQLESDSQISHLPFSVTIGIDAMYVPDNDARKRILEQLKEFVLWANQQHTPQNRHFSRTFPLDMGHKNDDWTMQQAIEAFVQIKRTSPDTLLDVGFREVTEQYNEAGITAQIDKAIRQLQASVKKEDPTALPVIALWSASSYLNFSELLYNDWVKIQLNEVPTRYDLIDWVFAEYRELAAIILFGLGLAEGVNHSLIASLERLAPFGVVITSPFQPEAEAVLKSSIVEKCSFEKGISSDPLA